VIEKVRANIEEFFWLLLHVKEAYAQEPYNLEGHGQAFVVSEEQKLDWVVLLVLRANPKWKLSKFELF